ncbi:hypothetical protein TGMAS_246635 [Toxoplasma gondii MAS]|uniref:Uncharacterized protein n=2 Tax=Toxoplasma gondii TaxID=5811 RepID=A0A086QU86_TOXGO|nr:hypothetical protein TGMAS_246635 [Toxoplasma gondii MAS]PUA90534.1 hypothetical protein TGBR9_246635 [Toxoplasma gondii TgCATBr9]
MSGDSAGFEVGTVSSADLARHLKLLRNDLFRRCRNQQTARPTSGAVAVQGTQSDVPGTVNSLRSVMGRMASARTPASPYRQSVRPSQQRLTLSSRATEDSVGGGSEVPQERQVTHRLASSRSASPVVDTGSDSSSTACRSPKGTGVEKKKQTARRSPLSHRSSCSPSPKESDSRGSRVAATKAGERKKTATETAVSVQSRALQQKFQGLTAKYSNLVRLAAGTCSK